MKRVKRNDRRTAEKWRKFLPLALIALAALAFLLIMNAIGRGTTVRVREPVYQYFGDSVQEYDAKTKIRLGDMYVQFESGDESSAGDATPIYYKDREAFILPCDMAWTDPSTGIEWCLPALSTLTRDGDSVWCKVGRHQYMVSGGFLTDEKGTFVTLERSSATVNGETFTLAPLSFYSSANGMIRVYNHADQSLYTAESLTGSAVLQADSGFEVDLAAGIYTSRDGEQRLLAASPSALRSISEK